MSTIAFPVSPTVGQLYTFGGTTWQCAGTSPEPWWNTVFANIASSGEQFVPINYFWLNLADFPFQDETFVALTVTDLYVYIGANTSNVNLYTLAGSPTVAVNLHVVVASGVTISAAAGGTGAANAAMQVGAGWVSGSSIILTGAANSVICGHSGAGGLTQSGTTLPGNNGNPGSDGLYINAQTFTMTVTVSGFAGTIAGGGGGGGSGGSGTAGNGGPGGAGSSAVGTNSTAGTAGTGTGFGAGGAAAGNNAANNGSPSTATTGGGGGGSGGGVGHAGGTGGTGDNGGTAGGTGGASGYAIRKNGNTLSGSPGTSYGTIG